MSVLVPAVGGGDDEMGEGAARHGRGHLPDPSSSGFAADFLRTGSSAAETRSVP